MKTEAQREKPFTLEMPFDEALERFARVNTRELEEPEVGKKASPFIKWAGGKRSLLPDLVANMPPTFNTYYEPFLGGAALFFEASDHVSSAVLTDTNFDLVITFNVIKRDPEPLIKLLEEHTRKHNSDYYYRIRTQSDLQDPIKIAARFIYLNKTCYNGLWRVNKKGQFNVPIGRYTNVIIYQRANLIACHKALQNARIEYRDFETITPNIGDFVYCDPPYYPIDATSSFTKYTKIDFTEEDQMRLRDFALRLHNDGVLVMVSNSDTPLTRDLYSEPPFNLVVVQAPRLVNCRADRRHPINELIITTY